MIFMETFLIGAEVELEMQQLLWKGKACVSWLALEMWRCTFWEELKSLVSDSAHVAWARANAICLL